MTDIAGRTRLLAESHADREGALLPILHDVQAAFGFVPKEAVPVIADVLNLGTIQRGAYLDEQRRAIFTFDAVKSQFDQFVGLEATVDLRQDGGRQSFLADGNDGIQMMRGGAKGAALGRAQLGGIFSHGGIVA